MKADPENILQHLLYASFSRLSLKEFTANLAAFLIEYMPLLSLGIRRFENKSIVTISYHTFNNNLFPPPKVIDISDELMKRILLHPAMLGYKYAARIITANDDAPHTEVHLKLFRKDEVSIYLPLIVDELLTSTVYVSISSLGVGSYNEEHLRFCEKIRAPLAAALGCVLQREAHPGAPVSPSAISYNPHAPTTLPALGSSESEASFPTLDEVVRMHIRRTLTLTQGRVSGPKGAAKLLGVPSSTLASKIRRLGISVLRGKAE